MTQRIQVIDSHTGGEPTRIIFSGGPDLGTGNLPSRVQIFRERFDGIRKAVVNEPRGNGVFVGGLICEPCDSTCSAGIIFFNNASYLGMCGHGTIGLMVTLQHLNRIQPGLHRIETPVGVIQAQLSAAGEVTVTNVPSYRYRSDVVVEVPNYGRVVGDIAWGGNWFFLVKNSTEKLTVEHSMHLTRVTMTIRQALQDANITAAEGAMIDHIELFGSPHDPQNDSRNFVLCPGGAYDRSPCGTGTSAKLACLAADQKLAAGEKWRQESIIGSLFVGSFEQGQRDEIIPSITGTAYVCGESTLILNPADPFCMGIC